MSVSFHFTRHFCHILITIGSNILHCTYALPSQSFPKPKMCVTGCATELECRYIHLCSAAETGKREEKGFSRSHCGPPTQDCAPQVVVLACHPVAGGADASHGALRSGATQQAAQRT